MCMIYVPFGINNGDSSDIISRSQHEFVVHDPLRIRVVQHGRGMQCDDLIIFDRQVVAVLD
jgi:hypothetical protein